MTQTTQAVHLARYGHTSQHATVQSRLSEAQLRVHCWELHTAVPVFGDTWKAGEQFSNTLSGESFRLP